MTDAHDQKLTLHLLLHVPEHEARESDPYYHIFNATRDRMAKLGLLVCALKGCTYPGPIELHHSRVEDSLQSGVDLEQFNQFFGLHLADDDAFRQYIQGPDNLEPLCPLHHRGRMGVHMLPGPEWQPLRYWRVDMAPPAEFITAKDNQP